MGKQFLKYYEEPNIYICKVCKSHLSCYTELISKDFWAVHGKAFLYNSAINYYCGQPHESHMRTGLHRVSDIFCKTCNTKLGWVYIWAQDPDQKYKEGKVILERDLIDKQEWIK